MQKPNLLASAQKIFETELFNDNFPVKPATTAIATLYIKTNLVCKIVVYAGEEKCGELSFQTENIRAKRAEKRKTKNSKESDRFWICLKINYLAILSGDKTQFILQKIIHNIMLSTDES